MKSFLVLALCLASAKAAIVVTNANGIPTNDNSNYIYQGDVNPQVAAGVPIAYTGSNLDGRNVVYTSGSASSGSSGSNSGQTVIYTSANSGGNRNAQSPNAGNRGSNNYNRDCSVDTIYTTTQAVAVLIPAGNNVTGSIVFDQPQGTGPVTVRGTVYGLGANSAYGFHIHEYGNIADGCNSSGDHFNPDGYPHGDISDPIRHAGDLGNIVSDASGVANFNLESNAFTLNGDYDVTGRAIVVHSQRDDGGRGGASDSTTTGNSGSRLACGVIGINSERMDDNGDQRQQKNHRRN
ncbi:SOD_CuZN3 [Ramazzottius varieornatus]|uniref:Superoxide dismutase [Cu-Zn] n=1 Tax=Ramazzottius varieornatus TaxID=947166 RepID=A0A1D1UDY8_RAMVA|nr:SOD_CuZN3 [Ramazzottius varieornatus]